MHHPTSHTPHLTSRIRHPPSAIQHRGFRIVYLASRIASPEDRIRERPDRVWRVAEGGVTIRPLGWRGARTGMAPGAAAGRARPLRRGARLALAAGLFVLL